MFDFLHSLTLTEGDWQATISGIGPDLDAAQALTEELGLGARVVFSGYADYDAVPELYHGHHIFASPTYAEGFSNTILEAMASGLAVLSCRSVGVIDCVRDGDNGLLTDPGDIEAQARALTRLVSDGAYREELARRALEECRQTYSWEAVGRQIVGVYRALEGTALRADFKAELPLSPCRFRAEPHLL